MMKKKWFTVSGNKKNIAKISSGTLLGQIIAVLVIPLLTRIYGPNIIGVWTLLSSIATIVISFSDLGMTNAIMTENEEDIISTYSVISSAVALISVIAAIGITVYYTVYDQLGINIIFLFFMVMFMIFIPQQIQVCYTWLNRQGEYNVLMKNPVIQYGITGIVAIGLGLIGLKAYGYFIGHIIGYFITLIHMKRNLPKKLFTFNISEIKGTILRNNRFVLFQMPTRVLNNFLNQLPVILVQALWGTKILGYYSITVRILQIPSTLLASAIGRVFFQTISNLKREGLSIGQYVFKNLMKGMKIGIIPMALLMAFGDVIVTLFLGTNWKMAGEFVKILSMQYYFMFLMNTVLGLEIVLERQKYKMIANILQILGFIVGAFVGKYFFGSIYSALIIMSSFYIILQIIYFSFLFRVMNISTKKYIANAVMSIVIIVAVSFFMRMLIDYISTFHRISD